MRWSLLLVVPACSFGARAAPGVDAPGDTNVFDVPIDTPADSAPQTDCMARWMAHTVDFTTPVALTALDTTTFERDPFVSADERTIYFSTIRSDSLPAGTGSDIYMATRAAVGDPFGAPVRFAQGSSTDAFLSSNGCDLYFASTEVQGDDYDLFVAAMQ